MENLEELEKELTKLTFLKTFNVLDAFRAIDYENKGYISPHDIHRFFGYCDYYGYGYDLYHNNHNYYYHRYASEVI